MAKSLHPFLLLSLFALASCTAKYIRPASTARVAADPAAVARGEYLVTAVTACGACHGSRLSGSLAEDEGYAAPLTGGNQMSDIGLSLYVPNLTPDDETGLGRWTDGEILRAIRDGVGRDGHLLFPMMPFGSFQHLSDFDAGAIVAYLRTLPKQRAPRARTEPQLSFPARLAIYTFGVAHHVPVEHVEPPAVTDRRAYGAYLAKIAQCADCHALATLSVRAPDDPLFMSGSAGAFSMPEVGKVWAPNLTPDVETGLGARTAEQVKQALRTGIRLDGRTMAPPMRSMRAHYAQMTDADLDALISYLQSLPPVKNKVPDRVLTPFARAALGGP